MDNNKTNCIHWFRKDLRLQDNPAYYNAQNNHNQVLPIYIDATEQNYSSLGKVGRWWLSESLIDLDKSLNNGLRVFKGEPGTLLLNLCKKYNINHVYCNRVYDKFAFEEEASIQLILKNHGITFEICEDELLSLDMLIRENASKIFTFFYNKVLNLQMYNEPLPKLFKNEIYDIKCETHVIEYDKNNNFSMYWEPSERTARYALELFCISDLKNYEAYRDFPYMDVTSQLSPFITFGNISLRQLIAIVKPNANNAAFIRQVLWGEYSRYILHLYPHMMYKNVIKSPLDNLPTEFNAEYFLKWQEGKTGYAFVDAGMRQLKELGYMHNRLRMLCASFLIKNMFIPWQYGERWFWDNLLDANLANNSMGWQWVNGTTINASPFFRIFSPIVQMNKFDPYLSYTKTFVQEVRDMSIKDLAKPYMVPIVEYKSSRNKSLALYKSVKNSYSKLSNFKFIV